MHDDNLSLVARGTLENGVDLEADRDYFICATMPDGRLWSTFAKVEPNTTELVLHDPKFGVSIPTAESSQKPTADDPSASVLSTPLPASVPAPTHGRRTAASAARAGEAKKPAGRSPRTTKPPWQVVGFRGNLITGEPRYFDLEQIETPASLSSGLASGTEILRSWNIPFGKHPTFVQLTQPGRPVFNYAVPIGPGDECVARLIRSAVARGAKSDLLAVDIRLENRNADLLLRYVGNNLMQEAAQTANSVGLLAQDLLRSKFDSPIGAVVGAYALLRFGQLDRLHGWTQNLCTSFAWLPDGVVIQAEHLARVGEHKEALKTLMRLSDRGLPFFVTGLTYAINRLRQYQGALHNNRLSGDASAVDQLRLTLGHYSGLIDVARPILTFVGRDPLNPSRRPGRPADAPARRLGKSKPNGGTRE